jgi:hypothetical protein
VTDGQPWSMPLPDWQPTGSFREAATPPSAGPVAGTLVQLPCINEDWLPLVLGGLDQLRNPATWLDTLSDAALASVLAQVDYLRSLVGMAINTPCCNVSIRLTGDCRLQWTVDGGAHWSDVDGWTTNIGGCVRGNVSPPAPPNPSGAGPNQQACNTASAIAREIIEKVVQVWVTQIQITQDLTVLAQDVWSAIAFAFPIGDIFVQAMLDYAQFANLSNLADFQNAVDDPVLWSDLTCAIYEAIKLDGIVTSSNLASVKANIAAMGYTPSDVQNAISAFCSACDLSVYQQMQVYGAFLDADCSNCSGFGTNCYQWSFNSAASWTNNNGYGGTWVSGKGYEGEFNSGLGGYFISLKTGQASFTISAITLVLIAPGPITANDPWSVVAGNVGGPNTFKFTVGPRGPYPVTTKVTFPISPAVSAGNLFVNLLTNAPGMFLTAVQVTGTFPPGWNTPSPCTF